MGTPKTEEIADVEVEESIDDESTEISEAVTDSESENSDETPQPATLEFGDLREYQSKNLVDVFGDNVKHEPDAKAPISAGVDSGFDDVQELVSELTHLTQVMHERIQSVRDAKNITAIELYDLYLLGDDVRSAASDTANNFKDIAAKIGNTRSVRAARTRRSW